MRLRYLLIVLILSGCSNGFFLAPYPIDRTQKTMRVSLGSNGLLGHLKAELAKNGWKLLIRKKKGIKPEDKDQKQTRYHLKTHTRKIGNDCLWLSPFVSSPTIKYDISITDNTTREEVFLIKDWGCGYQRTARKIVEKIESNVR